VSQFNEPAFGSAPPPKKSSAMMWILIILGISAGLVVVCCGGCTMLGMWGLNQGSAQIATELKDTPVVKEHLGDNLTMSMNFTATANEQQQKNDKDLVAFDASGSKGKGTIIVTTEQGGPNAVQSAKLRLPDGTEHVIK
jgi:hypothetical protein